MVVQKITEGGFVSVITFAVYGPCSGSVNGSPVTSASPTYTKDPQNRQKTAVKTPKPPQAILTGSISQSLTATKKKKTKQNARHKSNNKKKAVRDEPGAPREQAGALSLLTNSIFKTAGGIIIMKISK